MSVGTHSPILALRASRTTMELGRLAGPSGETGLFLNLLARRTPERFSSLRGLAVAFARPRREKARQTLTAPAMPAPVDVPGGLWQKRGRRSVR
jgi:hypothetical protein